MAREGIATVLIKLEITRDSYRWLEFSRDGQRWLVTAMKAMDD